VQGIGLLEESGLTDDPDPAVQFSPRGDLGSEDGFNPEDESDEPF
jgi:hypothetical protein